MPRRGYNPVKPVYPAKLIIYSPDEMTALGLDAVKIPEYRQRVCRDTTMSRFQGYFGSKPHVLAIIWEDLQKTTNPDARIDALATKRVKYFFLAMHFLWVYPTEIREGGQFDCDEKTGRGWRWYFVGRIRALKKDKIIWPADWSTVDSPFFCYSVDGVHFWINELLHPTMSKNPKLASHKNKKPSLDYEIALSLWESKVVHLNGPHVASKHDITVFREKLKGKHLEGRRVSPI